MSRGISLGSERGCSVWAILAWVLLVAAGVGLAWYGFTWKGSDAEQQQPSLTVQSPATAASTLPVPATATPTLAPTDTPPPTFTLEPTPVPPTPTPVVPNIVAGADGANVRAGPGTNFTRLGYLDPGAQARVTGRFANWWQIEYEGAPAWVFGDIVTASNVDAVAQVQPPPSPTPVPPTDTPVPTAAPATPTAEPTAAPAADFRGLVPNSYSVEDAPGPFGANGDIWFNMDISNFTGWEVEYDALGTWVQETGQFQKSWTEQAFKVNRRFQWRDHINIPDSGTYNLWMRICFTDGACFNMLGPVVVQVN
jgi:uncharacterized protein YraI